MIMRVHCGHLFRLPTLLPIVPHRRADIQQSDHPIAF